jgi:hypothetical protein
VAYGETGVDKKKLTSTSQVANDSKTTGVPSINKVTIHSNTKIIPTPFQHPYWWWTQSGALERFNCNSMEQNSS